VDKDFPPNDTSIGKVEGDTASGVKAQGGYAWAKASDIAAAAEADGDELKRSKGGAGGAHLFEGTIEPGDVLQGALGDCWLMAALACVAERPEVLQQAIVSKHVDPRGKYYFRLFNQIKDTKGTKWLDIVIDEMIPVEPGTLRPKFARTHCNEMWVLLLEKAFAKMYGGYDRLDGGQMHWALTAITGVPSISFNKTQPNLSQWACNDGHNKLSDDDFFDFLLRVRRNGAFVCCAMIAQANKMGLIDGHAYSIIQLQTVNESAFSTNYFRFVQIRNPHGQTEWQGAWSDKSTAWQSYPHVREELCGRADELKEDGTFWMQWEDFVQFWKSVQIVDCGTSIKMVATPVHRDPTYACLSGCFHYWCCCIGFRRLYCGRDAATDFDGLSKDMHSNWGCDQSGFYCNFCDTRATSVDAFHADDVEKGKAASKAERQPLCCGKPSRRDVSRA
jgi:calpain-15